MKTLLKCGKCGNYNLKGICECGGNAITPKPAKYNVEDKYGKYRRKAKAEYFKKEGLS